MEEWVLVRVLNDVFNFFRDKYRFFCVIFFYFGFREFRLDGFRSYLFFFFVFVFWLVCEFRESRYDVFIL